MGLEHSASCQHPPRQELGPTGTQGPAGVTHLRGSAICERRTNGRAELPLHFVLLPDANSPGCRAERPPPPPPAAPPVAVSSPCLQGRMEPVRGEPRGETSAAKRGARGVCAQAGCKLKNKQRTEKVMVGGDSLGKIKKKKKQTTQPLGLPGVKTPAAGGQPAAAACCSVGLREARLRDQSLHPLCLQPGKEQRSSPRFWSDTARISPRQPHRELGSIILLLITPR